MTPEALERTRVLQQQRWTVHLWLIVTFLASLVRLLMKLSIGVHVIIGLIFLSLVVLHLLQRRKRIRGLLVHFKSVSTWTRRGGRLAWSDLILTFIFSNLIVSGIADYFVGGGGIFISTGVIRPIRWHALSAILLLAYLLVHVIRRARRLRNSKVS
jgi:hypothetical protein